MKKKLSNKEILDGFQERGFCVSLRHKRRIQWTEDYMDMFTIKENELQDMIDPYGGITEAWVYKVVPYGEEGIERVTYFTALAKCNPKDRFNRKIGGHIALARAFEALEEMRLEWTEFKLQSANARTAIFSTQ